MFRSWMVFRNCDGMNVGSLFSGIGGLEYINKFIYLEALRYNMTNKYTYSPPCTEEQLWDLYVNQIMTQKEIADKFGVSQHVIQRAMEKMGINARKAKKRNQFGKNNSSWKGGRVLGATKPNRKYLDRNTGYWYLREPTHPNANKTGYVAEHTVVMCEKLGRPLIKGEMVHHINGDKRDNSPTNLFACDRKKHRFFHHQLESIALDLIKKQKIKFEENGGYVLC